MEKEDLVLGLFGPSNMQITHGFANDFSVTSFGFPKQIIFIPANTDYTLPYHKKKNPKQVDSQAEASRVFSCVESTSSLPKRKKTNHSFSGNIDQNS